MAHARPTVAVILALYNGASYIEAQMDSLLQQTCPIDQVIICDDGSVDGGVKLFSGLSLIIS